MALLRNDLGFMVVTTQLMHIFLFANFQTKIVDFIILAIRDDSNVIRKKIKCNCWPMAPGRSYDVIVCVITGHKNVYGNNSRQNRASLRDASLCLSCHDGTADMCIT